MTTTAATTRTAPAAVRAAHLIWLGALGAGVAEMLLRWSETPLPAAGVRLAIYAALSLVMYRMRVGKNWARWTLALLLGIVGTLSLVGEPIGWFTDGADVSAAIVAARVAHLLCVLVAVPLMFVPSANAYFR
jgi:hypothetical protein